jgi:hypothetical protein
MSYGWPKCRVSYCEKKIQLCPSMDKVYRVASSWIKKWLCRRVDRVKFKPMCTPRPVGPSVNNLCCTKIKHCNVGKTLISSAKVSHDL